MQALTVTMVQQRPFKDPSGFPSPEEQAVPSLSPEARRRSRTRFFAAEAGESDAEPQSWWARVTSAVGVGSRPFEVVRRTFVGTYNDGFIHAGNLAYLSMLSIFPFFILAGALFQLAGELEERRMIIETVLLAMPPTVRGVIAPVAENVIDARSGWLLWLGAAAGLWSVSSLIETIRDVLRRAYGTKPVLAFWRYRLASAGLIIGAVLLMLLSFFAQVVIGAAQQFIAAVIPRFSDLISTLGTTRIVPALGLFGSLYLLFWSLAPIEYRSRTYPKWPGALFTASWWMAVTAALPPILRGFFTYDLTYGSLAGIMVALFFFWLVGLGVVIGAELNAALAEPEGGATANEDTTKENSE
ncbi:MAG: YihY/virulence factor BrkB family protein [Pseudomonadota bacterium]|nr:YihY/virulence factor BrkB family protein [Pseudomonadota bacterium]